MAHHRELTNQVIEDVQFGRITPDSAELYAKTIETEYPAAASSLRRRIANAIACARGSAGKGRLTC